MPIRRPAMAQPLALTLAAASVLLAGLSRAQAASPDDSNGLWLTAEQDAVVEFKPCSSKPSALCAHVVWDKDAANPSNSCGLQVAQFERYAQEAWREGWAYDPRDNKKFKAVLRLKNGELHLRAFVGAEVLGQTAQFTRVSTLPEGPGCKKS